eukprot:3153184-Pyramimonas_sp.AAC.1
MYTPGSRIHQNPRSCANFRAGSGKASVYRVRFPIWGSSGAPRGVCRSALGLPVGAPGAAPGRALRAREGAPAWIRYVRADLQ